MGVLFYSSSVCISAYANVYFKTTIVKQNIQIILFQNNINVSEVHCGSAVRFGQVLPGFLITAQSCMHPCCNWVASCVAA